VSEDTMSVVDRIRDETEFKPKPSALCDWCEYNDRCPSYPKQRPGDGRALAPPRPPEPDPDPDPVAKSEGQLHLFHSKPQIGPS
jgi:hypothetical protein